MNLVEQYDKFLEIYPQDNIFSSINSWVDDSKKLQVKTSNRLSDSEALSACLTGELPKNLRNRRIVTYAEASYELRYIKEVVSQIDDNKVKYSCLQSLYKSKQAKNLIYVYPVPLTKYQKSRVRVICRLVWYNLYPKEVSSHA